MSIHTPHPLRARTGKRWRHQCADYARFEALKTQWRAAHQRATPDEYQAAMRHLASQCGV